MKEIIVEIDNSGEIKITTKGFTGKSCITESAFLKKALGKEIAKQLTPAFYDTEKTGIKKHLPLCG